MIEISHMTHSDLLPRLGFKVRVFRYAGDDVHLRLRAVDLGHQVPFLLDNPSAIKARLFVKLPDSCIDVVLSLLKFPLGESPCCSQKQGILGQEDTKK